MSYLNGWWHKRTQGKWFTNNSKFIVANHVQNVRSSPSFGSYAESVTLAWDDDIVLSVDIFFLKKVPQERARTTNSKIGPVADQIYEICNCRIFVIWICRGKSKLCICTKHLLLIITFYKNRQIRGSTLWLGEQSAFFNT